MPRQEQGIEWYLTPSGEKRYRVRWREGTRQRSRTFRRLTGEHGARAFRASVSQAQQSRVPLAEAAVDGASLAVFVADVWAPKAKRRLAPKSWETTSRIYNKHILHRLGDRPLAAIDVEALVEWQDALEAAGVGSPTIVKAIGILSSVFGEAARRPRATGVRANPVALLDKPAVRRRRRPLVWGPVVVERVRLELLVGSRRSQRTSGRSAASAVITRRISSSRSPPVAIGSRPTGATTARATSSRRWSGSKRDGGSGGTPSTIPRSSARASPAYRARAPTTSAATPTPP